MPAERRARRLKFFKLELAGVKRVEKFAKLEVFFGYLVISLFG